MRSPSLVLSLVFWVALTLLLPSHSQTQPPQTKPSPEASHPYKKVAKDVLSRFHFATDSLPGYHTEVEDLVFGPNAQEEMSFKGVALMELRGGRADVSVNDKPVKATVGDYWAVPSGAHLRIRNLGELAIIRKTLFVAH